MMRGLVGVGTALVVFGAAVLLWVLFATPEPEFGTTGQIPAMASQGPPRIWSIVAGLALAGGAALVGIGMNQWKQGRPRTIRR